MKYQNHYHLYHLFLDGGETDNDKVDDDDDDDDDDNDDVIVCNGRIWTLLTLRDISI